MMMVVVRPSDIPRGEIYENKQSDTIQIKDVNRRFCGAQAAMCLIPAIRLSRIFELEKTSFHRILTCCQM